MGGLNGYIRAVLLKDFQKIYSQQQKGLIIVCCQHLAIFTHNRILSKKVVISNISLPCLCFCMHKWMLVWGVFKRERKKGAPQAYNLSSKFYCLPKGITHFFVSTLLIFSSPGVIPIALGFLYLPVFLVQFFEKKT